MATALASTFERLKKHPFPEFAESDELADWQADLAELDGYIAGIATTILAGGTAELASIRTHIDKLRQQLETVRNIPIEDHKILLDCKQCLNVLDEVAKSMGV